MDATELGLLPSMHCAEGHTNILGDLRRLSRGGGDGRDRASGHTLCKHTLLVSTCIVAAALVKLVYTYGMCLLQYMESIVCMEYNVHNVSCRDSVLEAVVALCLRPRAHAYEGIQYCPAGLGVHNKLGRVCIVVRMTRGYVRYHRWQGVAISSRTVRLGGEDVAARSRQHASSRDESLQ